MIKRMTGLAVLFCAANAVLGGDLTSDDLVFEYRASENFALAQQGGSVQGKYNKKNGSIVLVKLPGSGEVLEFKNPGSDTLEFPTVGNLPQAEGTMVFSQAYRYDSAAILKVLKEKKQWSKMFFLFRTSVNSGGVGLFHEVNTSMPESKIRLTVMISFGPHQWQYQGVTLNKRDFPPEKLFYVGLSWKGKDIALLINGKVVHQASLKTEPSWGSTFFLGGTGDAAFDGVVKAVKIYGKAAF